MSRASGAPRSESPSSRTLPKLSSRESLTLSKRGAGTRASFLSAQSSKDGVRSSLFTTSPTTRLSFRGGTTSPTTTGTPYEQHPAGKPPVPITVAPRPSSARIEFHPSLRQTASAEPLTTQQREHRQQRDPRQLLHRGELKEQPHDIPSLDGTARQFKLRTESHDPRRDSAIAVSNPAASRDSRATFVTNNTTDDERLSQEVKKPHTDEASSQYPGKVHDTDEQPPSPELKRSHSLPRMNGGTVAPTAEPSVMPATEVAATGTEMATITPKQSTDALPVPAKVAPPPATTPSRTIITPKPTTPATTTISPRRSRLTKKTSITHDAPPPEQPFVGLTTDIPTTSFDDWIEPDKIEFSKRGSMLIAGQKANEFKHLRGTSRPTNALVATIPIRVVSPDEELMSRRVRSMYATGAGDMAIVPEGQPVSPDEVTGPSVRAVADPSTNLAVPDTGFQASSLRGSVIREEHELAGGFEDWQDVEGGDVDRYGFISPKPPPGIGSTTSLPSAPSPQLHRVSTQLQMASEQPRRPSRLGRSPSNSKSTRSAQDMRSQRQGPRPVSSQASYRSTASTSSRLRTATNRLPHNRERRLLDEAGDMLTLPPGLADLAAARDGGRAALAQRAKEWTREAKWRKMARLTKREAHGGGMTFAFDTAHPKLVARTWKGIPDRWRATAWHSFLATSARRRGGQPADAELIAAFHTLQDHPSPDDGQIDTDVPRTIGAHIMFRARYRGGQRLLFRVLHALSLFFPATGYVQGMAALAATLLCYYDETLAFVMLVRLWILRGLDRLYAVGFDGLTAALDELGARWLAGGAVGAKLTELGIAPTSYGTRWYLTLFNYSIPFPAQLRVWDVFFLLGDPDRPYPMPVTALPELRAAAKEHAAKEQAAKEPPPQSTTTPPSPPPNPPPAAAPPGGRHPAASPAKADFAGGLDVLHATAAALVDATREIVLEADFETAMKTLTSWVPVRDEELLMRVVGVELRRGRKR